MSMTIHRRKTKRLITEEEALALKEIAPFCDLRQDAKAVNFGLIFGMSYKRFSANELETKWSIEKIDNFIKDKDIEDIVDEMAIKHSNVSPVLWRYYAVAKFIRDSFFKSYPGLLERIERNQAFIREHGYIRSFHGGIRRVPLAIYAYNEQGRLREDEDAKEVANWNNIASNTSIQTDEVCSISQAINEWESTIPDESVDNGVSGTVHDSVDFYVLKEGSLETLAEMQSLFEKEEPWMQGMKFPIDLVIVDLEKEDHYYKHGYKYKKFKELAKEGKVSC